MNLPNELLYLVKSKLAFNHLREFQEIPLQELPLKTIDLAFRYKLTDLLNYDDISLDWAAAKGNLKIVEWLYNSHDFTCCEWAINWAAANGHLEVIKWLYQNYKSHENCQRQNIFAIDLAKKAGNQHIIDWFTTTLRTNHLIQIEKRVELFKTINNDQQR